MLGFGHESLQDIQKKLQKKDAASAQQAASETRLAAGSANAAAMQVKAFYNKVHKAER